MISTSIADPALPGQRRGFETLATETVLDALPATGAFPAWLQGSLYRNGPAQFEVGPDRYRHWFDGLGMLHRFTIDAGRVSYANRFLASNGYREARRTGRITLDQFDTKARVSPIERLRRLGRATGSQNANVNIVPCGDELLALTETPEPLAFDALSLETRGVRPYTDDISAQTITAHPHHDARKKRSINLATQFGRRSTYHVVAMDDGGSRTRRRIGSLTVDHPSYLHTFALTERYALIVEFPFVLANALDMALGRHAYIENFRWQPERGTRFHAMRLDDGSIERTWQGAPFFAFHHINAFDDGRSIVLDVSAYDDASIVTDLRLERLRTHGAPLADASFRRYRLDFGKSSADYETLARVSTELPRVASRNHGRPYAYAYGISTTPERPDAFATAIVKVATADGAVTQWTEHQAYPGEPVFVGRPGGTAEDDGAILSVVLDGRTGTSFLIALDAADFRELARASLPHHMPFGFHGTFVRP
jgi:carotenoid cleavage dioxygenase-like enzyme